MALYRRRRSSHCFLRRFEFPQRGLTHGFCGAGRLSPRREPVQHHSTLGTPVFREPFPFGHLQRRLDRKPGAGLHRALHLLVFRPQLRRPVRGREIRGGLFGDGHECKQFHPLTLRHHHDRRRVERILLPGARSRQICGSALRIARPVYVLPGRPHHTRPENERTLVQRLSRRGADCLGNNRLGVCGQSRHRRRALLFDNL